MVRLNYGGAIMNKIEIEENDGELNVKATVGEQIIYKTCNKFTVVVCLMSFIKTVFL